MGTSALLRVYVEEMLQKYPELRLQPSAGDETALAGRFEFSAQTRGQAPISDCYEISISVASDYPRTVPLVRETADRIPRNFHKLDSGHLCLGSPLVCDSFWQRRHLFSRLLNGAWFRTFTVIRLSKAAETFPSGNCHTVCPGSAMISLRCSASRTTKF